MTHMTDAVDRAALIRQIDSLLSLDERGALSPHGIGGLARELLQCSRAALTAALAQAETQPVGWIVRETVDDVWDFDPNIPVAIEAIDDTKTSVALFASPVPAKREAGVDGKAVIRKIVTGVLTDHCGQQGGLPRVDWYALRGELIEALATSSTPADGEGTPAPVQDLVGINTDLLNALKYVRRFLNPEDHDVSYVDDVIDKAEERGLYAATAEGQP